MDWRTGSYGYGNLKPWRGLFATQLAEPLDSVFAQCFGSGASGNIYSVVLLDETAIICVSLEAGNEDRLKDSLGKRELTACKRVATRSTRVLVHISSI
jgi:hypothetical protein